MNAPPVDAGALEVFVEGYLAAMELTESLEGQPYADLFTGRVGLEESVITSSREDCRRYLARCGRSIRYYKAGLAQAGTDFWYARNDVDFSFDRGGVGEELYRIARDFPPVLFRLNLATNKVEIIPARPAG
jgi:hypothetical protein